MNTGKNYLIESIAGLTTFLTMAYIIFVNPQILAESGMDKTTLVVVTCLVSGIITIASGIFTKTPLAMAPGMGLNAFFTYGLVLGHGLSWRTALGIVFISGFFFLVLTWLGLRRRIVKAIPADLLQAIAVGIGIFIAFIGLQNLGLVVSNEATLIGVGALGRPVLFGLTGLGLMVFLEMKRIRGALLLGIVFTSTLFMLAGLTPWPEQAVSFRLDLSALTGQLDIMGALRLSLLAPIFTLMFMDLFDSIGTLLACGRAADLDSQGRYSKSIDRLLTMDASATMFGAFMGTSTTTAYIESASGIAAGGRTGLTAVVCGLLFLLVLPVAPLLAVIPPQATAPALIMVGFAMMKSITRIDFTRMEIAFPSFVIILFIAFTFSISTGLAFGFLSYSLLAALRGQIRAISPTLWLINLLCLVYFLV